MSCSASSLKIEKATSEAGNPRLDPSYIEKLGSNVDSICSLVHAGAYGALYVVADHQLGDAA